jgi:hypothetical protein
MLTTTEADTQVCPYAEPPNFEFTETGPKTLMVSLCLNPSARESSFESGAGISYPASLEFTQTWRNRR